MHVGSSRPIPEQKGDIPAREGQNDVTAIHVKGLTGNIVVLARPKHTRRGGSLMRFKSFIRREINDDRIECFQFGPEHYSKAGIPYSPFGGMPVLEAHEIVNDLNQNRAEHQFVYYLAA
jgi:hypothetical protein